MIKNITCILTIFLLIFLYSCSSNEQKKVENSQDTTAENMTETDNEDDNDLHDTITQIAEVYEDEDLQEAHENIEKEFGVQWDFCTCIVKNDSIDKAISGDVTDADLDFLLERLEFVDEKCKGMLIQPNSTPDERNEHEKKVRKCLKANK